MNNDTVTRAVLVYGTGSGLGKSTLAKSVTAQLTAQGIETRILTEDYVTGHPAFRAYVQQVEVGNGADIDLLMDACHRFIPELTRRSGIVILDSLLPCWDWLFTAGCDDSTVSNFTESLSIQLAPLHPLLVVVEGNLDVALSRAIQDRGEDWALDLAERRTGQRNRDALRNYFRHVRDATDRMVSVWPHSVVRVNTEKADLKTCTAQVVHHILGTEYVAPLRSSGSGRPD